MASQFKTPGIWQSSSSQPFRWYVKMLCARLLLRAVTKRAMSPFKMLPCMFPHSQNTQEKYTLTTILSHRLLSELKETQKSRQKDCELLFKKHLQSAETSRSHQPTGTKEEKTVNSWGYSRALRFSPFRQAKRKKHLPFQVTFAIKSKACAK